MSKNKFLAKYFSLHTVTREQKLIWFAWLSLSDWDTTYHVAFLREMMKMFPMLRVGKNVRRVFFFFCVSGWEGSRRKKFKFASSFRSLFFIADPTSSTKMTNSSLQDFIFLLFYRKLLSIRLRTMMHQLDMKRCRLWLGDGTSNHLFMAFSSGDKE